MFSTQSHRYRSRIHWILLRFIGVCLFITLQQFAFDKRKREKRATEKMKGENTKKKRIGEKMEWKGRKAANTELKEEMKHSKLTHVQMWMLWIWLEFLFIRKRRCANTLNAQCSMFIHKVIFPMFTVYLVAFLCSQYTRECSHSIVIQPR